MMFWRSAVAFGFLLFMGLNISHAFNDLPESDPNRAVFDHLRDIGVMKGFSDGNFYPTKPISRAEALVITMRAADLKISEFSGETYFVDVDPNTWYAPFIKEATERSLIGQSSNRFRPDETITKAEFLNLLFRTTKAPLNKYQNVRNVAADIPNNEWFTPVFAYAKKFQIAQLPANNYYYPEKQLNRQEVGLMTYRQLRLMHGSEATGQVIELQAAINQFVGLIKEDRYEEAEFHLYNLIRLSETLIKTKNNQDSVAANALSQSMQHLSQSFRSFKFGRNLDALSNLHMALKQAQRAEAQSEAMAPFANDLQLLIHETLSSLTAPDYASLD